MKVRGSAFLKRGIDSILATMLAVLLSPVLLCCAIGVATSGPGPILIRQRRVGREGVPFEMYKLRTMVADAEPDGRAVWCAERDPRVTPIGRFLRLTHLDEAPQLWNVLRGDMSLVGPRPERVEISHALDDEFPHWHRRHLVRPGITGWAQVRQGYASSVSATRIKLHFDLEYVRMGSVMVDIGILALTACLPVVRFAQHRGVFTIGPDITEGEQLETVGVAEGRLASEW